MRPDSWHSYSQIFAMGHMAVKDILVTRVNVEEKIDGSQISFCVSPEGLMVRSKGAVMHVDAPERMFLAGVQAIKELVPVLQPGWTYSGEYLQKPKHNTLAYSRVPRHHIILFDIKTGSEQYLSYAEKQAEAERIGMEVAPLLFSGFVTDMMQFRDFLDRESILGGQKVEGVVVKPVDYAIFGQDKKVLMAKFVSEQFKEVHAGEWRKNNPTSSDILMVLSERYRTPARWTKALIHLRECGSIEGTPRDIGKLIPAVKEDILKECADEIREELFQWAWDTVQRRVVHGVAEWYKEELARCCFEPGPADETSLQAEVPAGGKA